MDKEPIWIYDGKILDGRNRYKACVELGITPEFRQYRGADPLQFVLSLNLARRHLNSSQCAFVALEVEKVLAREAKERQVEAIKKGNTSRHEVPIVEKIPQLASKEKQEAIEPKARDKAAEVVGGTNARYVQDAKRIEAEAPEVKALVMAGTLNMPDAVKVARLAPDKRAPVLPGQYLACITRPFLDSKNPASVREEIAHTDQPGTLFSPRSDYQKILPAGFWTPKTQAQGVRFVRF